MEKQNPKIALIGDCLANGGAEKVHALLSIYFHRNGFEVHNCILKNVVGYEFAGQLHNLGKLEASRSKIRWKFSKIIAFYQFLQNGNFDYIIDFRMRNKSLRELLFMKFFYPTNSFLTVHSAILNLYFPHNSFLSRFIFKKMNLVSVSNAIAKKLVQTKHCNACTTIHNPIDLKSIDNDLKFDFEADFKYILGVGSMNTNIKQFDQLISCYAESDLPQNDIKLLLLGSGKLQKQFRNFSKSLGIDNKVIFLDFQKNPFPIYKNALFTVLCSKNEGFPNVLIESLACETPVVAFDCFSGPSEIIDNGINGILVDNQNFDSLKMAINKMVSDQNFYDTCKANARKSVRKFDIEIIGEQWKNYLFERLKD